MNPVPAFAAAGADQSGVLLFVALLWWLVAVSCAVWNMLDASMTPPARWSYVAAFWTLVLAPLVVRRLWG